jgi:hypothetical protein
MSKDHSAFTFWPWWQYFGVFIDFSVPCLMAVSVFLGGEGYPSLRLFLCIAFLVLAFARLLLAIWERRGSIEIGGGRFRLKGTSRPDLNQPLDEVVRLTYRKPVFAFAKMRWSVLFRNGQRLDIGRSVANRNSLWSMLESETGLKFEEA